MAHQLGEVHEAIRVGTFVGPARELDAPVRCDQAERIPAPRAPRLGDAARLEHDVVDARLLQVPAGGETRLARSDDRDVRIGCHAR